MKTYLMTTILSAGLVLNLSATAADNIVTQTQTTASKAATNAEIADPRLAATGFVEHINFARVALAMKNSKLAEQHIAQARNMVSLIKNSTTESRRITDVQTGRIVYQSDSAYKYYYFPIETGPVEVKEVSNGPIWATSELAVTDADIVYLTLDLTGDDAQEYLNKAETEIAKKDLKAADNQLAKLTDKVVKIDRQSSLPNEKARDNIALARNFIAGKNYDGASYALNHADKALDEMQRSDGYETQRDSIAAMRSDVKDLQGYIEKKDPTMIQKADAKMKKWWEEMKTWSDKKTD